MVDSKVIPKHCQNDLKNDSKLNLKRFQLPKGFQNYFGPITL